MKSKSDPFLGILTLDTNFPRPLGDIGNPQSFAFPTQKKIIKGAFPAQIVKEDPSSFLPLFLEAAEELVQQGAKIITTSCGFLTPFQNDIAGTISVPFLASSLFLFSAYEKRCAGQLGILTISAKDLSSFHLAAANIPSDVIVHSPAPNGVFVTSILGNKNVMDLAKAEAENVNAAIELKRLHPQLKGILLECTNMPPYAGAIKAATGLPVYSILDGLNELWVQN